MREPHIAPKAPYPVEVEAGKSRPLCDGTHKSL